MGNGGNRRNILIFDGVFCRYSERLTGPDGQRVSEAQAAVRLPAETPGKRFRLRLYLHVPGAAPAAEWTYGFISRRRSTAARASRALRGAELYPEDYKLVAWVFLRLLALIYLAAFASLAVQITGLAGADGILPLSEYLDQARLEHRGSCYWRLPTLFWWDSSDRALRAACWMGIAAASAAFFGVWLRGSLLLCYLLYLSLAVAGQRFTEFQWDLFLLECGFLALFLPSNSRIPVWLYRWLLFRFMFMGGVVKLASGDPGWRNLTALRHHLETQPLPSPLAWWAYQLPDAVLQLATGGVLIIELVIPFLVFLPGNPRRIAAAAFLLLQGAILLTGNYNFFNLLTIALCVFLLEDRDLRPWLGVRLAARIERSAPVPSARATASAAGMAFVSLVVCGALLWLSNTRQRLAEPLQTLVQVSSAFGIVNGYGPFAVISAERREILIEGSEDGENWQPYEFRYKPGAPARPLRWNVPHQPRLDWQMWFAAQGDTSTDLWFPKFMRRLAAGSAPVLALLERNPFPAGPPRRLRASLYHYRFAPPAVKAATGQVWQRERLGDYRIPG